MGREVLLYVPNIIGYLRLLLLLLSLVTFELPAWFLSFYITSAILDGFDGYFARKLNQTSTFGAWLDVIVDVISRGFLWCFITKWGYAVIVVEWMTFLATHQIGSNWRVPEEDFPPLCKMVMAKGFKTPIGTYAITGVHVLPLWLYGYYSNMFSMLGLFPWIQHSLTIFLIGGRLLAMRVEVFYIYKHIERLLDDDDISKRTTAEGKPK